MSKGRKTIERKLESATKKIKLLQFELEGKRRIIGGLADDLKEERDNVIRFIREIDEKNNWIKALIVDKGATKENPYKITPQKSREVAADVQVIVVKDCTGVRLYRMEE